MRTVKLDQLNSGPPYKLWQAVMFNDAWCIMDKQGNSSTLGQTLLPQYKKSIESGEQKGFNLLGDGK